MSVAQPSGCCHVSFMTPPLPEQETTRSASDAWHTGSVQIDLSRPRIMGILNVTPDSFYDGGRFNSENRALARAEEMIAEGADIIDVGGESSRPAGPYGDGAEPVSAKDEIARTAPVIERIAKTFDVPISIDTTKSEVARVAVESGASIVNDISASRSDPAIADTVASTGCGIVLMHMKGTPTDMQRSPTYVNVVREVSDYLSRAADDCVSAGVARNRIVIDPGFGFGKSRAHNLELLGRLGELRELGFPVLAGASRKTFVDPDGLPEDRLAGSLAAASFAVFQGAQIIRVHDIAPTAKAIALAHALASRSY